MKDLSSYTQARVSLGSAGDSLPTAPLLALRLAHAKARDGVSLSLDTESLRRQMAERSWPSLVVASAAGAREEYLRRPDLGRRLASHSEGVLAASTTPRNYVFAVSDGLCAPAAERHAIPLLEQIFAMLPHTPTEDDQIIIVKQGRVAISDPIGERCHADALILLIGERPGLSSPDSLGIYITWRPRPGRTDAERNCISNIHHGGLSYRTAAAKTVFLLQEMRRLNFSGVALKDTSAARIE